MLSKITLEEKTVRFFYQIEAFDRRHIVTINVIRVRSGALAKECAAYFGANPRFGVRVVPVPVFDEKDAPNLASIDNGSLLCETLEECRAWLRARGDLRFEPQ